MKEYLLDVKKSYLW